MAGILRGVLFMLVSPVLSIIIGIGVGRGHGLWYGFLSGFGAFLLFILITVKLVNSQKKLTTADCLIPIILSVISGVVFAPVQLFMGSVFSMATCVFSGILMSFALYMYKEGRMKGWAIILPALTFIYELLPIELPTDLDNIFALGGSATMLWWGYVKRTALKNDSRRVLRASEEADID